MIYMGILISWSLYRMKQTCKNIDVVSCENINVDLSGKKNDFFAVKKERRQKTYVYWITCDSLNSHLNVMHELH